MNDLMEAIKNLRQITGAGFDRLNVIELRALGIPVANIPCGSANAGMYLATGSSRIKRPFSYSCIRPMDVIGFVIE